jgi:hypothetical protein
VTTVDPSLAVGHCLCVDEISQYLGVTKEMVSTWISAKGTPAHRGWLRNLKREQANLSLKFGCGADRQNDSGERK